MKSSAAPGLCTIAQAIADGSVTSLQVVEQCLERIARWQPGVNAFVTLRAEAARARARQLDAAARPALPLYGVPLAHKDLFYRQGQHSSLGSRVQASRIATRSSTLLQRLDAAGAVDLGALSMAEFALGPTGHNAAFGDCRNAWQRDHVSCGSSSGGGVAVAARLVYGAFGSDTGGSVRLPASANGVLGLKPTHGRVTRAGMMALAPSIDVPGLFAREARDAARLLGTVAGSDPADARCSRRAVPDYEAATLDPGHGLRLGLPEEFFFDELSDDVAEAITRARRTLERAGFRFAAARTPYAARMSELSRAIVYSEASALHGAWLRDSAGEYTPQARVRAATGLAIPAPVYLQALQLRPTLLQQFVAQAFADCDLLLLPTLCIPVPTLAETAVGGGAQMWQTIALMVRCTAAFNYLGLPALSVPCGFTRNGLPTSFQLVARPFDEVSMLRVAAAYQRATDWHRLAPPER